MRSCDGQRGADATSAQVYDADALCSVNQQPAATTSTLLQPLPASDAAGVSAPASPHTAARSDVAAGAAPLLVSDADASAGLQPTPGGFSPAGAPLAPPTTRRLLAWTPPKAPDPPPLKPQDTRPAATSTASTTATAPGPTRLQRRATAARRLVTAWYRRSTPTPARTLTLAVRHGRRLPEVRVRRRSGNAVTGASPIRSLPASQTRRAAPSSCRGAGQRAAPPLDDQPRCRLLCYPPPRFSPGDRVEEMHVDGYAADAGLVLSATATEATVLFDEDLHSGSGSVQVVSHGRVRQRRHRASAHR